MCFILLYDLQRKKNHRHTNSQTQDIPSITPIQSIQPNQWKKHIRTRQKQENRIQRATRLMNSTRMTTASSWATTNMSIALPTNESRLWNFQSVGRSLHYSSTSIPFCSSVLTSCLFVYACLPKSYSLPNLTASELSVASNVTFIPSIRYAAKPTIIFCAGIQESGSRNDRRKSWRWCCDTQISSEVPVDAYRADCKL